jgi:hypothetical protein
MEGPSRPFPHFSDFSWDDTDGPFPLRVILGLISFAPRLQDLSIAILGVSVGLDSAPVHDIHLGSLHRLELTSGTGLVRVIPHLKVPQLKELSLTLPFSEIAPTIADLLPSDSHPLITEVTSMAFSLNQGRFTVNLEGEGIRITVKALTNGWRPLTTSSPACPTRRLFCSRRSRG